MLRYQTLNRLCGWICFVVSSVVYVSTVEPSASFWDCPEFILAASRLEIGHPPGAPFFMLIGNLFSHFAPSPDKVAYCINVMSALLSGGCVMFLFWTVTHLVDRLCPGTDGVWRRTVVMGCGFTGALTYAFTDTFWFSAVEAEVYAFSSFLTAVTFWLILQWESEAGGICSGRWLVLLAYVIGLSVGVHLLNLLCIPAIALVMYYRLSVRPRPVGVMFTLAVSFGVIAVVLYGIVPGIMKMAAQCELLAVNVLGMSYNVGFSIYAVLLFGVLLWLVVESCLARSAGRLSAALLGALLLLGITLQGGWVVTVALTLLVTSVCLWLFRLLRHTGRRTPWSVMHTLAFCLLMVVTGYSSYTLILIRSTANPPMDQQSPEEPFALRDYLGREQYGSAPLLYGHTFASPRRRKLKDGYITYALQEGEPVYRRADADENGGKSRYMLSGYKAEPLYQQETCMWFPRMHSADHADAYREWVGDMKGREVTYRDEPTGERRSVLVPTVWDNLRFFLRYQVGYMYMRYFLWNFVGRQDDVPGRGGPEHGNWLTGISSIDKLRLGGWATVPEGELPDAGRNVFYGLPFVMGLLGLLWQMGRGSRGRQQGFVVMWLFLMTGLAIVLYLNQKPLEPRERDYAYAGSFYAFSIWIGMGTAALSSVLRRHMRLSGAVPAALALSLVVPLQMVGQTWDDHDRSGRQVCRDMGMNYLHSLQDEGYPVIFVNGDNETFPLWYGVEVEGVRTDVRVCNLMYLTGAWYVDQMRRPARESPALPLSLPKSCYRDGVNDAVAVNPVVRYTPDGRPVHIKEEIERIYAEHPGACPVGEDPWEWDNIVRYWLMSDDEEMRCIPTDEVHIRVDPEAVRRSGMVLPPDGELPAKMVICLTDRSYLLKTGLVLLDLISQCNWERPLYVANTLRIEEYINLSNHLVTEGMASRIVPYDTQQTGVTVDVDRLYDNVMHKFCFGGLDRRDVWLDYQSRNMADCLRHCLLRLYVELEHVGQVEKADTVIALADKLFTEN